MSAVGSAWTRPRRALVSLALYAGLVGWCTWPLAAHLTTHLPDTGEVSRFDLRQMVWAQAWQTHILTTDPARFFEANAYHPTPHALLYADAGYGALPFFLPTMVLTGNHILAANLMLLGSLTLTIWGTHLLAARWTGLELAGFVAAGTLLTSRWLMWRWVPEAPNYAVLQYYPAIIGLAANAHPSRGRLVLLAVLVVLQGVVSPYVGGPVIATLGVLGGWRLLHAATRRSGLALLVTLAAAAAIVGLVYAPNLIWLRSLEPQIALQSWWRFVRHTQVLAVPFGWFVDVNSPMTIAAPLLALVATGVVVRSTSSARSAGTDARAWIHGGLWLGVALALMVTPWITVFGHRVALPHAVLADRPPLDLLRSTHRLGVGGLFGLALLAGASFAVFARQLLRVRSPVLGRLLAVALAVGLVGSGGQRWADMTRFMPLPPPPTISPDVLATLAPEAAQLLQDAITAIPAQQFSGPIGPWIAFPVVDARVPDSPVRDALRRLDGPVVHVEYIVGPQRFHRHRINAQAMFETIGRWYPVVNGYGGFYPRSYPMLMRLALQLPDAKALRQLRGLTGVEQILVRGTSEDARMARWEEMALRGGDEGMIFVARAGDDLLFRVRPDPGPE
jgi:hypothetical protein